MQKEAIDSRSLPGSIRNPAGEKYFLMSSRGAKRRSDLACQIKMRDRFAVNLLAMTVHPGFSPV